MQITSNIKRKLNLFEKKQGKKGAMTKFLISKVSIHFRIFSYTLIDRSQYFRKSDVKTLTATSNQLTTKDNTLLLHKKDSSGMSMTESFFQKALVEGEDDDYEDSMKFNRPHRKRAQPRSYCCSTEQKCIIF